MTPNIHTIIRQHVALEVRCIDRLYLHAYMPKLQTSGGLCYFLHDHLGYPVPSPALLKPRLNRFVAAVEQFAATQHLAGELFKQRAGIDMLHVPYKGSAPAVQDLLAGQVQVMFDNLPSVLPLIRAGRLRAHVGRGHRFSRLL